MLPPTCTPPDPNPIEPSFDVPAGACDCHAHIFEPGSDLVVPRDYSPPAATFSDYTKVTRTLGLSRSVIVQPSVYGTDNKTTLQAVANGGTGFRAVVVVDDDVSQKDLRSLSAQGACGARFNALFSTSARLGNLNRLSNAIATENWHLQILADISTFPDLEGFVKDLPVPVVFDHFGHMPVTLGCAHDGFQSLLRLLGQGRVWVKLSGSYRITGQTQPPYSDVTPFAQALITENPDNLVWGSDWPHPQVTVPMPNDGDLLNMIPRWAHDSVVRQKILVDNPARLYGFENISEGSN